MKMNSSTSKITGVWKKKRKKRNMINPYKSNRRKQATIRLQMNENPNSLITQFQNKELQFEADVKEGQGKLTGREWLTLSSRFRTLF